MTSIGIPFAKRPTLPPSPRQRLEADYARGIVAAVVGVMVTISAVVIAVGVGSMGTQAPKEVEPARVGNSVVWVSWITPSAQVVTLALLGIVAIAAGAVTLEALATLLTLSPRRDEMRHRRPTALRRLGGPVSVTVLIPARNEQNALPATLAGLQAQTRLPNRVIVVSNNCTDRTVEVARAAGVEVFETVGNVRSKAGALNEALTRYLPSVGRSDVVMVMDADTVLDPHFISVAAGHLEADPGLAAVGGIFYGEDGHGLIGQLQRNEYIRYALQLRARHGRVFVLTGTATLFRAEALLDVAAARGIYLPGEPGCVYDAEARTEDNEITLALKSLGATMVSPYQCRDTTELMPTWRDLRRQRLRWQRGALENLASYGLTQGTLRYWAQQFGLGYGVIALWLALTMLLLTLSAEDRWIWYPFWLAIGSVFVIERVVTVWTGGWRARALAILMVPELLYELFLQTIFLTSLVNIALVRPQGWGHVERMARS